MIWVVFLITAQLLIAAMVFFILKGRLSSELIKAALEKLHAAPIPPSAAKVTVQTADELDARVREYTASMIARKAPQAAVVFEQSAPLKGGIIIDYPGGSLDFSVATRLKNFWV